MANKMRQITKKTNIFDGQRINEKDLSADQVHHNALVSNLVIDFHGSGIVEDNPFQDPILLDTRSPGLYAVEENASKTIIQSGNYDGRGLTLDLQPSDLVNGNRLELELVDVNIKGRNKTKILILGKIFDGLNGSGTLNLEFLEFSKNGKMVTQNFYQSVVAIFLNNFSGGSGRTEVEDTKDSLNLITLNGGYLIVREAPSLKVYPFTKTSFQVVSPNFNLIHFVTSSQSRGIVEEIELALGSTNTISDLYIELDGKEKLAFDVNSAASTAYGQKFLSKTDNIQRVDLLLSVEGDDSLGVGHEYDFSGELVVSIHELISEVNCPTDSIPDDLIDFDPDITPLVEVSYNQEDLELLGYKLNSTPQIVGFNFAGTLIADPNIGPSIQKNKYYAILISRRGDNRTGNVLVEKGFDTVDRKTDLSVPLTIIEEFGKQQTKFVQFDPISKRYVNDSQSSLWYCIYTDAVEITNGTAYSDTGIGVTVEKTEDFVGDTKISHFENNISLRTVAENANNYLILSQSEKFLDPGIHPRTNNRVFTRILDVPEFTIVNSDELASMQESLNPVIMAKINDLNVRDSQTITGELDKPGLIGQDYIIIVNPSNNLLSSNLVNRVITPDVGCNCNSKYRIAKVDCLNIKAGDFNSDGEITNSDLGSILDVVGSTINSSTTVRAIFNGDLDIIDFIKADLNEDGIVDGLDIELLENAVDGYVNFTVQEEIKVLYLRLENILEENNYPIIFTDVSFSGVATAASNTVLFTTLSESQSLAIRIGDSITISSESVDTGTYTILSKIVDVDRVTVSITVENTDGTEVSFAGSTGFNVTITSGTEVNTFADNLTLLGLPFSSKSYEVNFIDAPFEEQFLNICDLRRKVASTFLEEEDTSCLCIEDDCSIASDCSPVMKNQYFFPGDIYLPNGSILTERGLPHPGDFEYTTIKIPLPPGSINDCTLDLYNNFVKSKDGGCFTTAGYPAMKYSDGSLVGCQDSGTDTDVSKGRVKFDYKISSIFVDSLTDGYVEDGYTTTTSTEEADVVEFISENFIHNQYNSFDTWNEDSLNDSSISSITHTSGTSSPAIFALTTSSDSGLRIGKLNAPSDVDDFSGDFIVDFSGTRISWDESSLTNGTVTSFAKIIITNDDGSISTLKLGWKVVGGYGTKLFYSGVIEDSTAVIVSTFSYEIDAPDELTDVVNFRLRRVNDVVSAYYIIPDKLVESTAASFGQYVRIGENPEVQPGDGTCVFSYEINQEGAPTPGLLFYSKINSVDFKFDYSSDNSALSSSISKDTVTKEVNRIIVTFPFNLPRRTVVDTITLNINSLTTDNISGLFQITPLTLINANNLGLISNVPIETDSGLIKTFSPGSLISGQTFSVDVTSQFSDLLATAGQVPGFIRGFIIEPSLSTNSSFEITSILTLTFEYEDSSTGIVFKVGVSIDPSTGIVSFNTKNILYDNLVEASRTTLTFGVYLKKSGFKNQDVTLSIQDLSRLGIGSCFDEQIIEQDGQCFYIVSSSDSGTILEGPIPCDLNT